MIHSIAGTSTVYVDTNIFIHFIEASPTFFAKTKQIFEHIDAVGARIVTSEITLAECLYKPSQDQNTTLVAVYGELFEKSGDVSLIPLDGMVAKRAALRGGGLGLKLVDAIHYVSALEARCDLFITTDAQFRSDNDLEVWRISEQG